MYVPSLVPVNVNTQSGVAGVIAIYPVYNQDPSVNNSAIISAAFFFDLELFKSGPNFTELL